ncbi:MAG TPA: universal stress protein [Planctomycetota bacterium]|nr:universal stress protein [Planctomycetota bacterium]
MEIQALRVLVPLDGSTEGEAVVDPLVSLKGMGPLRVTLMRVVPPNESGESAKRYLGIVRERFEKQGIPAETRTEWGEPAREIRYCAGRSSFDLVAMTSHGRSGLKRAYLGSVTEEVLRHSELPLLVVRPGVKAADWKRVVVPLDGSALAERILPDAARLAKAFGTRIQLLRVTPSSVVQMMAAGHAGPIPAEDPGPYLQEVGRRLSREGIASEPAVRRGDPVVEICRTAEEVGAGAICLATHGRTGLPRALLGSVAEGVLRAAPCPVYVLRTLEAPVSVPATAAAKA